MSLSMLLPIMIMIWARSAIENSLRCGANTGTNSKKLELRSSTWWWVQKRKLPSTRNKTPSASCNRLMSRLPDLQPTRPNSRVCPHLARKSTPLLASTQADLKILKLARFMRKMTLARAERKQPQSSTPLKLSKERLIIISRLNSFMSLLTSKRILRTRFAKMLTLRKSASKNPWPAAKQKKSVKHLNTLSLPKTRENERLLKDRRQYLFKSIIYILN